MTTTKSVLDVEVRKAIVAALKERKQIFPGSDKGFSTSIGIHETQWNRIVNGNFHQVISDAKWVSLARIAGVDLKGKTKWVTAQTPTFKKIYAQLKKCQENSISGIFCDSADIGKTYAARAYVRENKYAVYVDCSQVKQKQKLVRGIAKEFGVEHTGKYSDVYGDLCYYLTGVAQNPVIVLDEAADLDYPAFLELKALWNATERECGWYLMGADGLKEKMRRGIEGKKVGFTEIFSRYGKKYQSSSPDGKEENDRFTLAQATMIIKANAPETADAQALLIKTDGSLRRIYTELSKL